MSNAPSAVLLHCSACHLLLSVSHYSKKQSKKREGRRRCIACIAAQDPQYPRSLNINPAPVCDFLRTLFSEEEATAFHAWLTPDMLARDDGAERSAYDLLRNYKPLETMCGEVLDSSADRLYPLQRAVVLGLEWEKGVRQLFEACDEIVGYPHPKSGLLPFQLAAATDNASLDLTYNLLRARPVLVLRELDDPNDMKYRPEFFSGYAAAAEGTVLCDAPRNGATEAEVVDWDNVEYVYSSTDGDSESVDGSSLGDSCVGDDSK